MVGFDAIDTDNDGAGSRAKNASAQEGDAGSYKTVRYQSATAIERQMAAMADRERASQAGAIGSHAMEPKVVDKTKRKKIKRAVLLCVLLALLSLLFIPAVQVFIVGLQSPLQGAVDAVVQNPALHSFRQKWLTVNKNTTVTAPQPVAPVLTPVVMDTIQTDTTTNIAEPDTAVPHVTEPAEITTLTVPVDNLTLQYQPDFFTQLVQVYRSQLAVDPFSHTARAALKKLQKRSMDELGAAADAEAFQQAKLLADKMTELFPALPVDPHFMALVARIELASYHDEVALQADQRENSLSPFVALPAAPDVETVDAQPVDPAPQAIVDTVNVDSPAEVVVNVPDVSGATNDTRATNNNTVLPNTTPNIQLVSITPGIMVEDRFLPQTGGKVLMVLFNYRYFNLEPGSQGVTTLVAGFRKADDTVLLTEVPIILQGNQGVKSFSIEAIVTDEMESQFQIDFILQGEVLATSDVVTL